MIKVVSIVYCGCHHDPGCSVCGGKGRWLKTEIVADAEAVAKIIVGGERTKDGPDTATTPERSHA